MIVDVYRAGAAFLSGLLFGFGLALSGMMDPTRVRGFLDIAGSWDPSLAIVLAGAVSVSTVGFILVQTLKHPVLDTKFHLPPTRPIDVRLLGGSALFGIGWGIAGLCPGPVVALLGSGLEQAFVFAAAMIIGMMSYDRVLKHHQVSQVR